MLRLVVTASAAGPMRDRIAMYATPSARLMRVGPETVPPGRRSALSTGWRTRTPSMSTRSICQVRGRSNAPAMNSCSSAAPMTIPSAPPLVVPVTAIPIP